MKHTQQELEAMTDFELAVIAAGYFLPCDYIINKEKEIVELANYKDIMIGDMHDQVLTAYGEYNPLGDWDGCCALADELDIEVGYINGFPSTATKSNVTVSCGGNIKRAITIVYILIKQGGVMSNNARDLRAFCRRERLRSKNKQPKKSINTGDSSMIKVDEYKLGQAALNLMANAELSNFSSLSICVCEIDGVQVQIKVTSDEDELFDAVSKDDESIFKVEQEGS